MNNLKRASEIIEYLKKGDHKVIDQLIEIYGNDNELIEEKKCEYISALSAFIKKYGDKDVIVSRAPGRVNLMGRHVEHRGGNINPIAIHRETIMVASKRDDDTVSISNVDLIFSDYEFSIADEKNKSDACTWIDYIDDNSVKERVNSNKGHWSNYVKGACLKFVFEFPKAISGMNIMCLGTVPVAGGVSSSSSIVVATSELVCALNDIEIERTHFISLCGQSEWYVGSRGGAGDHGAIKCGEPGAITPIEFEPINVLKPVPIPDEYSVIVANSFIEAKKSEGAKDKFNQMVASYEFGVMILLRNNPHLKDKIKHLRDINPVTLGISEYEIYQMLSDIPLYIKPDELFTQIPPEYHEKVKRIISSHALPDMYNLRSALFYGITECERSRKSSKLLSEGLIEEFAQVMNISHNGDRVSYLADDGVKDYDYLLTDDKLDLLIDKSKKNDPESLLYKQPGGYACSVTEIDILIDRILCEKGVLGAQISGAGLGGCIMILCRKDSEKDVLEFLHKEYYIPNNYPDGALIVKPIKGSMCLNF